MPKITAKKIGINGEGIGYIKRIPVFCEGLLPEEEGLIKIEEKHQRFYRASTQKVLRPSKFRRKSPCPYQKECDGCALMIAKEEAQKEYKLEILKETLFKYGNVKEHFIRSMHSPKEVLGYRSQCKLPIQEKDGKLITGLYAHNSNIFIPIEDCLIHDPTVEKVRKDCLDILNKYSLHAYTQKSKSGLRYIVIRSIQNKTQITLVSGQDRFSKEMIQEIMSIPTVISLFQSINTEKNSPSIFGSKCKKLAGEDSLEITVEDLTIGLSPESFYQIHLSQSLALMKMAVSKIDASKVLVEAYCGVGLMSLLAKDKAKKIIGIENNPQAIKNAKQNAEANHIKNVEFICDDAGRGLKKIAKKEKIDTLLVDPPRSGLDDTMMEAILSSTPQEIIYISCNPATLGKNIKQLKKKYDVLTVIPFDLFPQTPLIETLVKLRYRKGS